MAPASSKTFSPHRAAVHVALLFSGLAQAGLFDDFEKSLYKTQTPCFTLQGVPDSGPALNYMTVSSSDDGISFSPDFGDKANAAIFGIDSTGQLRVYSEGGKAATIPVSPGRDLPYIKFDTESQPKSNRLALQCARDASGVLSCSADGNASIHVLNYCSNASKLALSTYVQGSDGCQGVVLTSTETGACPVIPGNAATTTATAAGTTTTDAATTTTDATTAAGTTTSVPEPPVCNTKGWNKATPAFHFDTNSANANFESCKALCTASTQSCLSFAYSATNCLLFNVAVARNFNPGEASDVTFFDLSCEAPASVQTTTTDAGATTTTDLATTTTDLVTTTTAAATTTSVPELPVCNVKGWNKDTPAFYYDGSGANANFEACKALCTASTQSCLSFAYSVSACMLFNIGATSNLNANEGSPATFFDIACQAPPVQSTTTAAATTATATATSPASTTDQTSAASTFTGSTTDQASATTSTDSTTGQTSATASASSAVTTSDATSAASVSSSTTAEITTSVTASSTTGGTATGSVTSGSSTSDTTTAVTTASSSSFTGLSSSAVSSSSTGTDATTLTSATGASTQTSSIPAQSSTASSSGASVSTATGSQTDSATAGSTQTGSSISASITAAPATTITSAIIITTVVPCVINNSTTVTTSVYTSYTTFCPESSPATTTINAPVSTITATPLVPTPGNPSQGQDIPSIPNASSPPTGNNGAVPSSPVSPSVVNVDNAQPIPKTNTPSTPGQVGAPGSNAPSVIPASPQGYNYNNASVPQNATQPAKTLSSVMLPTVAATGSYSAAPSLSTSTGGTSTPEVFKGAAASVKPVGWGVAGGVVVGLVSLFFF